MTKFLTIALMTLLSTTAFAAKKASPCKPVMDACKAAGFTEKNAKNLKGTRTNCVAPLVEGKTVEGVTLEASVVEACKKTISKRKAKRAEVQTEAKEKRLESHEAK